MKILERLPASITNILKKTVRIFGVDIVRYHSERVFSKDVPLESLNTYKKVQAYTMTSPERIFSLCDAVNYINVAGINGDIVECGVWRGGSMMAVADTLLKSGDTARNLYLLDTFEGMPPPSGHDIDIAGVTAASLMQESDVKKDDSVWCYASLDSVRDAVNSIGYPSDKIHYVKGRVEQTIPSDAPEKIALLRLDTDWYESTKHELVHLFPRLSRGGVLIIDDYGHWKGARKAVDEYFKENGIRILLHRIDYTGRIAVKVD